MKRSKITSPATKVRNQGEVFLEELRGEHYPPLGRVQRALYKATGWHQAAMLKHLSQGNLVASVFWLSHEPPIKLPAAIWHEIDPSKFKIWTIKSNGHSKWRRYCLPFELVYKHCLVDFAYRRMSDFHPDKPLKESSDQLPGASEHDSQHTFVLNFASHLSTPPTNLSVHVELQDALKFSILMLNYRDSTENRGRRPKGDSEILLLEIIKRIALENPIRLGKQKALTHSLERWWKSNYPSKPRSPTWISDHIRRVYKIVNVVTEETEKVSR